MTEENLKNPTIVVIDEHANIGLVIRIALASEGYDVEIFDNQKAADSYLKDNKAEAIISGVEFKSTRTNGIKWLEELRENESLNGDTAVVIMSGNTHTQEVEAAALEAGADGFISKPFKNREALVEVIQTAISKRQQKAVEELNELPITEEQIRAAIAPQEGELTLAGIAEPNREGMSK